LTGQDDTLCKDRFLRQGDEEEAPFTPVLIKEPLLPSRGGSVDHRILCLGLFFRFERSRSTSTKESLTLSVFPWGPGFTSFKSQVAEKKDPQQAFSSGLGRRGENPKRKTFLFGELTRRGGDRPNLSGPEVTYLTDLLAVSRILKRRVELARGADHLFVEAAFLDRDRETAKTKCHLTAKRGGDSCEKSGVKQITLFHFSPRPASWKRRSEKRSMEAFWQGVAVPHLPCTRSLGATGGASSYERANTSTVFACDPSKSIRNQEGNSSGAVGNLSWGRLKGKERCCGLYKRSTLFCPALTLTGSRFIPSHSEGAASKSL